MLFNLENITIHTDASADELEVAVTKLKKDNGLIGLGEYFLKAQDDYNVNALILLAIACLESSYGLSDLAVRKNNLFGVDARDSLKGTSQYGRYFDSKEECINYAAHRIGKQYLEKDNSADWRYCNGKKDIWSIGMKWCSKKDWGDKVVDLARRLEEIIIGVRDDHSDEESENYKELYLELKAKVDKVIEILNEVK